ncbi:MAG TPA: TRAP transporter substrate-binding protein DctP [Dehalococcoidales bacterium]|nr:MAG: hypothetical protein A2Z05_01655 [Chloroflexi bacterium RBG_16_60_22]HJX13130.1 TRAP transporter substrate-binding protein DctP [Dehalococcoidales bacterium]
MKKALLIIFTVIIVSTMVLAGCGQQAAPAPSPAPGPAPAPAPSQPVVIKYGYDIPPTLPPAVGQNWWAEEVTKATEGRVKVEVYPASALVSQQSSLDAVLAGVADMYMLSVATYRKQFPISMIVGLPGAGFPDETTEVNVTAVNTFFEMLDKYPEARAEYDDFGPLFFYIIYSESYLLSKGKEIRVPADFKGLKVGSNGIRMELAGALGAAPVNDIPPLAYEKLQTGVTDATFAAISAGHDFQLWEVTDHVLDVPFGAGGHPIVINKATWNKISAKDQDIMKSLAPEGSRRTSEALAKLNALAWTEFTEKGMKVTATPQEKALWEAEFKKLWDTWTAEAKAAGLKDPQGLLTWWKSKSDAAWAK